MNKAIFNLKTLVGGVGLAVVFLCVTLIVILWVRPAASSPGGEPASAALTVIPAPSSTPRYVSPAATATLLPPLDTPTALPGTIAINVFVQITGTEGEGLRLRTAPGLDSEPIFLGYDAEVFQVIDGPREVDGHIWWHLTAPYDQTRSGWAVQDYLTVIQSP